ncbi:MAG: TAT-variant-translocated molybdopterin oxidoreductase [Planctomycetota bacterium]|jgi:molybdopterin-containing oxidoreductase family iron-sulfur binding subunit
MSEAPTIRAPQEKVYWRSLEELSQTAEFQDYLHREFPEGASEAPDLSDPISRRRFLGAVAASAALVSLASCRKPVRHILPYNQRPEGLIPGVPQQYATSLDSGGYGIGVLARSNDGRPTKIEGNPQHPGSLGGTNSFLQAEILSLYDPGRSRQPMKDGQAQMEVSAAGEESPTGEAEPRAYHFEDFLSFWAGHGAGLTASQGQGLHFLMAPSSSASLQDMQAQITSIWPSAVLHSYSPIGRDAEIAGAKIALGSAYDAQYSLDSCNVVVSFDRDFLGVDADMPRSARQFSSRRRVEGDGSNLNRLYVVESSYSVTGSNADHRFRVPASQVSVALCALAAELGVGSDNPALQQALAQYSGKSFDYRGKNWLPILAKDLQAQQGNSCVMVGASQPAIAHALAHAINQKLGNLGKTVNYTQTDAAYAGMSGVDSLRALVAAMNEGRVDTLVMLESNPVYDAPADMDFATALAKVPHRIHLGLYVDETAKASSWHINGTHQLEAWGDIRAFDGTASIVQPLIAPLHGGHSSIEFLAHLMDSEVKEGYEIVRAHWRGQNRSGDFDANWNRFLNDGLITDTASARSSGPSLQNAAIAQALTAWTALPAPTADNLEINFKADASVLDGRYSNNAWLQELPDPLTKLTWDNAAIVSPATAEAMDLARGDMVSLRFEDRSLEAPIMILPGHADHCVTMTLGYGRDMGPDCLAAEGSGFNANALRSSASMHFGQGLNLQKSGGSYELITTQDHGSMEGRPLIREATLSEYQADPGFAPAMSPLAQVAKAQSTAENPVTEADLNKSLWKERDYSEGYQWGMVIDLNTCTGCNACVLACTSENNIPMVGKSQVGVGREMFWNRLDRYFMSPADPTHEGETTDPEPVVRHQMIPCMQCENAPCESVCPVAATMHSPEGLNDMAYNRCIGTRYCGNNCPFKVRRFNFFNLTGQTPDVQQLAQNPDVSIRPRGVMEKCTYCVQRISSGKRQAKDEGREVRDGDIVPACAQGCPTEAISFGNILDENSKVARQKAESLNYGMLSELNLKTRTTFLAKVTNPNPELA